MSDQSFDVVHSFTQLDLKGLGKQKNPLSLKYFYQFEYKFNKNKYLHYQIPNSLFVVFLS